MIEYYIFQNFTVHQKRVNKKDAFDQKNKSEIDEDTLIVQVHNINHNYGKYYKWNAYRQIKLISD